jgi:hypothetical protein
MLTDIGVLSVLWTWEGHLVRVPIAAHRIHGAAHPGEVHGDVVGACRDPESWIRRRDLAPQI